MELNGRRWVAALLVLGSTACYRTNTVVQKVDSYHPRTWVGATVPEIEAVWGPAKPGESDGLGGRIISYRGLARAVPQSAVAAKGSPSGPDGDSPGLPDRDLLSDAMGPAPVSDAAVDAKFWVDSAGKVYRYWFSESIWKDHPDKATPPANATGSSAGG